MTQNNCQVNTIAFKPFACVFLRSTVLYVKVAKFVVGEDNERRLKNGIFYTYDELGRVVEVLPASYEYTRDGVLYRVTDHRSGRVTEIKYYTRGRAVGYVEYSEDEGERY